MKAVHIEESTNDLYIDETDRPVISKDELLVKVKATALNRADLDQNVIDSVFDWKKVNKAHQLMEQNKNAGKIVLHVQGNNFHIHCFFNPLFELKPKEYVSILQYQPDPGV